MTANNGFEQQRRLSSTERRQSRIIAGVCGGLVLVGVGLEVVDAMMTSVSFNHIGSVVALGAFVGGGTLLGETAASEHGNDQP